MRKPGCLFCILLLSITLGCSDSLETEGLPICIQSLIEEQRESDYPIQIVSEQVINAEAFYLVEDILVSQGESNFIINQSCDTICYHCSDCMLPACSDEFPRENWSIVWEHP